MVAPGPAGADLARLDHRDAGPGLGQFDRGQQAAIAAADQEHIDIARAGEALGRRGSDGGQRIGRLGGKPGHAATPSAMAAVSAPARRLAQRARSGPVSSRSFVTSKPQAGRPEP